MFYRIRSDCINNPLHMDTLIENVPTQLCRISGTIEMILVTPLKLIQCWFVNHFFVSYSFTLESSRLKPYVRYSMFIDRQDDANYI